MSETTKNKIIFQTYCSHCVTVHRGLNQNKSHYYVAKSADSDPCVTVHVASQKSISCLEVAMVTMGENFFPELSLANLHMAPDVKIFPWRLSRTGNFLRCLALC